MTTVRTFWDMVGMSLCLNAPLAMHLVPSRNAPTDWSQCPNHTTLESRKCNSRTWLYNQFHQYSWHCNNGIVTIYAILWLDLAFIFPVCIWDWTNNLSISLSDQSYNYRQLLFCPRWSVTDQPDILYCYYT